MIRGLFSGTWSATNVWSVCATRVVKPFERYSYWDPSSYGIRRNAPKAEPVSGTDSSSGQEQQYVVVAVVGRQYVPMIRRWVLATVCVLTLFHGK